MSQYLNMQPISEDHLAPMMSSRASLDFLHGRDFLTCPHLKDVLEARPSPFIIDNYHGGGFVSDADRVDLQAVHFASRASAGQGSQGKFDELLRSAGGNLALPKSALRAGPRETVYHAPATSQVASGL